MARIARLRDLAQSRSDSSERIARLRVLEDRELAAHRARLERARARLGDEGFAEETRRLERVAREDAARAEREREDREETPDGRRIPPPDDADTDADKDRAARDLEDREVTSDGRRIPPTTGSDPHLASEHELALDRERNEAIERSRHVNSERERSSPALTERQRLRAAHVDDEMRTARIARLRELAKKRSDARTRLDTLDRLEARQRQLHRDRLARARERLGDDEYSREVARIDRERTHGESGGRNP